jgi:hypothetical protein
LNTGAITFEQYVDGRRYGPWGEDEVLYLNDFNPTDDKGPAICAADVALGDAGVAYYLTRFASQFFENGAMPITTVSIAGLEDQNEKKRIQEFFRRALTGLAQAFRVLALGADVKIQSTQSPLKDLATPDLKEQARKDVALAFEIPVTLLDDDANYATAKEHKRSFYDETVLPAGGLIVEELNEQWLNPLGLTLKLVPEEMELYQEDEAARAGALKSYTDAGFPLALAAEILGIELPEGWDYDQLSQVDAQLRQEKLQLAQAQASRFSTMMNSPNPSGNEQRTEPKGAAAQEAQQFKNFAAKRLKEHHPEKLAEFKFEHLSEDEQAALKAEVLFRRPFP